MMDTKQILQEVDLIGEALNIICQRSNFQPTASTTLCFSKSSKAPGGSKKC